MNTFTAQAFSKDIYSLAESPFYDYRTKTLSWVAIWAGSRIEKRSGKDGSLLATVNVDAKGRPCTLLMQNIF